MTHIHMGDGAAKDQAKEVAARKDRARLRKVAQSMRNTGVPVQPMRLTDGEGGPVVWSNEDMWKFPMLAVSASYIFYNCPLCERGFRWNKSGKGLQCPHCDRWVSNESLIDLWTPKKERKKHG